MANKLAGYRKMLGKTQEDMAFIFRISRQAYSNKEKGKTPFKDDEKQLIKELLQPLFPDITIDEIFFSDK